MNQDNQKARVERITDSMREQGMDILICLKPENTFYLSGFNPIIYSHPVITVLTAQGDLVLLIHALRDDHAKASTWVKDVRLYGKWSTKKTMGMSWTNALKKIVDSKACQNAVIGLEDDFLPYAKYRLFQELFPKTQFRDASGLILGSRAIKDPDEINNLRIAAKISDFGMKQAIDTLANGGSEKSIVTHTMAAMNKAWEKQFPEVEVCDFGSMEGGVQNGLWCWCLAGERVGYNCDNPTNRVPKSGELVTIFIWACVNGMHAENERTVAKGMIDPEKTKAFEAILEIRKKTQPLLSPQYTCAQVFEEAAKNYKLLGYEKYLPGRIGHGMGLGCHEQPSLAQENPEQLKPGMVMSFEPNLRIPSWGGVQHSDTVLITETGCEFLTTTERGLLRV